MASACSLFIISWARSTCSRFPSSAFFLAAIGKALSNCASIGRASACSAFASCSFFSMSFSTPASSSSLAVFAGSSRRVILRGVWLLDVLDASPLALNVGLHCWTCLGEVPPSLPVPPSPCCFSLFVGCSPHALQHDFYMKFLFPRVHSRSSNLIAPVGVWPPSLMPILFAALCVFPAWLIEPASIRSSRIVNARSVS